MPATIPIFLHGLCALTPQEVICPRLGRRWPLSSGQAAQDLPDSLPDLGLGARLADPDLAAEGSPMRHFRASRLIAQTAALALADAGLAPGALRATRTGFVSGSTYGCAEFLDTLRAGLATQGPRAIRPTDFAIATQGYPMAALTMIHGANGPATAFVSGEASAQEALAFAETLLRCAQADRMVVVQYDIFGPATRRHRKDHGGTELAESITALVLSRAPGGLAAPPRSVASLLGTSKTRAAALAALPALHEVQT